MDDQTSHSTFGVLYPGEMGSSFGKLLCEGGFHVITTAEGRSLRTRRLAEEACLPSVNSLEMLLNQADVIISLVAPGSALPLAIKVAALLDGVSRKPLYVDANSISPLTVAQIADVLHRGRIDFVDASIFGLASQLRQRGTMYLSGARATELSSQLAPLLRVKVVGDTPGQASAFKMIISGIPKGLSALFVETMLFARDMHLLPEAMAACDEIYPSVMEIMRRMLPTYPQHAARRCEEIQEIEKSMFESGLKPRITHAVREVTSDLSKVCWTQSNDARQWTMEDVIETIYQKIKQDASDSEPLPDVNSE